MANNHFIYSGLGHSHDLCKLPAFSIRPYVSNFYDRSHRGFISDRMTNIVGITNMVWMVVTGTVPVAVQTFDEAHYWTESTYFFIAGFGDGFFREYIGESVKFL